MITTDIIINENRVFTDVSINFQNKEYSLKVFGKHGCRKFRGKQCGH